MSDTLVVSLAAPLATVTTRAMPEDPESEDRVPPRSRRGLRPLLLAVGLVCGAGLLAPRWLFRGAPAMQRSHRTAAMAPLLSSLQDAERDRNWGLVQERAQELVGLMEPSGAGAQPAPRLTTSEAETLRHARLALSHAAAEQQNLLLYDRFLRAAGWGAADAAVLAYGDLPEDSVYRQLGAARYQELRALFVTNHLAQARLLARRSCREAAPHLDAALAVWPAAAQEPAVRALAGRCGSVPAAAPESGEAGEAVTLSAVQPVLVNALPADPERTPATLDDAQHAYVGGNYRNAIVIARRFIRSDPERAWRVIGGAACYLGDAALVRETLVHLDGSAQRFVHLVCQRNGLTL